MKSAYKLILLLSFSLTISLATDCQLIPPPTQHSPLQYSVITRLRKTLEAAQSLRYSDHIQAARNLYLEIGKTQGATSNFILFAGKCLLQLGFPHNATLLFEKVLSMPNAFSPDKTSAKEALERYCKIVTPPETGSRVEKAFADTPDTD